MERRPRLTARPNRARLSDADSPAGGARDDRLRILVIGGGPAGLTAAISAARAGASVAVAERMDRVGKKLLASGNGRCNLSNTIIDEEYYHGAGVKPAFSLFAKTGADFIARFFESIGVLTAIEDGSRIYPRTFNSNTVLDALRSEAARLGVSEMCLREAVSVDKTDDVFITSFSASPDYISDRVIITAGGMASPYLGSNGSGYKLFADLGHNLITPVPALTRLFFGAGSVQGLKGIRIRARLTLFRERSAVEKDAGGNSLLKMRFGPPSERRGFPAVYRQDGGIFSEAGELLFTDNGVSGIPAFNLSCNVAPDLSPYIAPSMSRKVAPDLSRLVSPNLSCNMAPSVSHHMASRFGDAQAVSLCKNGEAPAVGLCENGAAPAVGLHESGAFMSSAGYTVSFDLFPEYSYDELYEFIHTQVKKRPEIAILDILCGILNKRIAALIARRVLGKCEDDDTIGKLTCVLKDWRHDLIGTAGFENAQATYGGVSLNDFSSDTLESKIVKGLFAAGEILDITGECGGYNLHWAWVSGYVAGAGAAGSA